VTAQRGVRGDVAVLVPAAGQGVRLGPGHPKALRCLSGEPLLVHAIRRAAAVPSVGQIVVAAAPGAVKLVSELLVGVVPADISIEVIAGGSSRQASVASALTAVGPRPIVLVHDAARALAPPELFERVAAAVREGHPAVIPVVPIVDTIKYVDSAGMVGGTVDRTALRAVQTPQGFRRDVLVAAHGCAVDEHTDDAGLAEKLGVPVFTVPGDDRALKITRPVDLVVAEALLTRRGPSGRA
jgi:2-C-methyl-D-erythritol 4-phosphate cytidylyltransferase